MIYNGFMFFNEFNMLDIRLNELWDVVDKFILVESPQTHRGGQKKLFFDERKKEYEKYRSKLIHVIHSLPNSENPWENENEHRRGILQGLKGIKKNDYLIINDADEIPRASVIKDFKDDIAALAMRFYYYKFNMQNQYSWNAAMMLKYGMMTNDINTYRADRTQFEGLEYLPDAGWHFSKVYCMENMKYMFKECLADDLFHDEIIDTLEQKAEDGVTDWCGHTNKFSRVDIDETFPKYIRENTDKFKDYIR